MLDQMVAELVTGKKRLGPSLVILVGVPLAGKSTLAAKLSDHGLVHVWATKIRKRYGLSFEEIVPVLPRIIE
jgi:hypothetical protein